MGTPKQLSGFSVAEMTSALSLAKQTAMLFRSRGARAEALHYLRVSLAPMTEWLDKPIQDYFPELKAIALPSSVKRALPLFPQFGEMRPVALARTGDWITVASDGAKVVSMSSIYLGSAISRARHDILCSFPWPYDKQSLMIAETMGMKEVVEHCAFLKYLACGMETFDNILKEREHRLHTIRKNFSFLESFVAGIDPLEHRTEMLPGFSLFFQSSHGGTSRSSATYFISGPVEKAVVEKNNRRAAMSGAKYFVFEEPSSLKRLSDFLFRLCISIGDVPKGGSSGREPFSKEETKVITDFVSRIGTPKT